MEEQQREENAEGGGRHTRSTSEDDQLITDLDKEVIDESDIIMTFLNKSECSWVTFLFYP